MCVYICIYIYTYIHLPMHTYAYINATFMQTHARTYIPPHTYTYINENFHTNPYTHMHALVKTYIHTNARTYMQAPSPSSSSFRVCRIWNAALCHVHSHPHFRGTWIPFSRQQVKRVEVHPQCRNFFSFMIESNPRLCMDLKKIKFELYNETKVAILCIFF